VSLWNESIKSGWAEKDDFPPEPVAEWNVGNDDAWSDDESF
jgi:hypothetical protein